MTTNHHYFRAVNMATLSCACGHVEVILGALARLNQHIRSSYSDEEWEALMQKSKLATVDSTTGLVKTSKGDPS